MILPCAVALGEPRRYKEVHVVGARSACRPTHFARVQAPGYVFSVPIFFTWSVVLGSTLCVLAEKTLIVFENTTQDRLVIALRDKSE